MQKKEAKIYLLILLLVLLGALMQGLILSYNLPDDIDMKYQSLVLFTSFIVIAVTFVMLIRLSSRRNSNQKSDTSDEALKQSLQQRIYIILTTPAHDMKGTLINYAGVVLMFSIVNIIATVVVRSMITNWKAVRGYDTLTTVQITTCLMWTLLTRAKLKKLQDDDKNADHEKLADSNEDEA